MGLFDFVKNIGRKVFHREEDAATKLKELIEKDNPGVDGLSVSYQDGVVNLSGTAKDKEAMEKAVLMAGNVEGVGEVKIDGLSIAQADTQTDAQVQYYIIEKGDTLSKIAKQYYGDANQYPKIFEANREVIRDADLIFPGQKIRIPA